MSTPFETGDDELISRDINAYLVSHYKKTVLRFITCGSVDDGKSTLIGRLLFDSKAILEDQLQNLEQESKKFGTQGSEIDFALLVDGLSAERQQGITIDVAYRFFGTDKRMFIIADTPGHEQFTRNMVTAASTADLAVVLVDARNGVTTQTRRHCYICQLLGVKKVVLAINKMDRVGYKKSAFTKCVKDFEDFAGRCGLKDFVAIPLSALFGDNIATPSVNTNWYHGPSLLDFLETVDPISHSESATNFAMPVQLVNRPNDDFRGYSGRIVAGRVKPNDNVMVLPEKNKTTVKRIVTFDGNLDCASYGQSITLELEDNLDCSRGQIICDPDTHLEVADQFEATIIWMSEEELKPGRSYLIKIGSDTVSAVVAKPKYCVNVNTLERIARGEFSVNDIGVANVITNRPIAFSAYNENRHLGGFIIIDKLSNNTVGAGLIHFALRRSQNVQWQTLEVSSAHRAELKHQEPKVVWMTGISGSGKSTIANAVDKRLTEMKRHTFVLDGDNVRHGLNKDLGFTDADRIENLRRVGEVAALMADAGLIVIVSFISPFRSEREMVRDLIGTDRFFEVFIDTPLVVAEQRDVKGLYKKARSGELKNFTGIDSPYEKPEQPDLCIDTVTMSVEQAADAIVALLI